MAISKTLALSLLSLAVLASFLAVPAAAQFRGGPRLIRLNRQHHQGNPIQQRAQVPVATSFDNLFQGMQSLFHNNNNPFGQVFRQPPQLQHRGFHFHDHLLDALGEMQHQHQQHQHQHQHQGPAETTTHDKSSSDASASVWRHECQTTRTHRGPNGELRTTVDAAVKDSQGTDRQVSERRIRRQRPATDAMDHDQVRTGSRLLDLLLSSQHQQHQHQKEDEELVLRIVRDGEVTHTTLAGTDDKDAFDLAWQGSDVDNGGQPSPAVERSPQTEQLPDAAINGGEPAESLADAAAATNDAAAAATTGNAGAARSDKPQGCARFSGDDNKEKCCTTPGCAYIGFGCLKVHGPEDEDKISRDECGRRATKAASSGTSGENEPARQQSQQFEDVGYALNAAKKAANTIAEKARSSPNNDDRSRPAIMDGNRRPAKTGASPATTPPAPAPQQLLAPPAAKVLLGQASVPPSDGRPPRATLEQVDRAQSDSGGSVDTMRSAIAKMRARIQEQQAQMDVLMAQLNQQHEAAPVTATTTTTGATTARPPSVPGMA